MISWTDFLLVPVTMSFDCMTVGATDGIKEWNMKWWKIILCSFLFGLFQAVMPVIGYFIGYWIQGYFGDQKEIIVGWVAFTLLMLLSSKSMYEWIKGLKERKASNGEEKAELETQSQTSNSNELTIGKMFIQAIATSIDALSIGFVYMDKEVGWAMSLFATIGVVTWILSILAILFGKVIGPKLEKWGDLIASIVFCLVAVKIVLGAYGIINF